MKLGTLAAACVLLAVAAEANACRVATPQFDPAQQASDLIVRGTVASVETKGGFSRADVRVTKTILGESSPAVVQLNWWVYDGRGMCAPPAGPVRAGQDIVIYFKRSDGHLAPQYWTDPLTAKRQDFRIVVELPEAIVPLKLDD